MKGNKRIFYIFGTAAVIILLFFVLFSNNQRRYSWMESYEEEDKDPYGTYIVHQLLQDYFPNQRFKELSDRLHKELPSETKEKANYVFVGEGIFLDTTDIDRLLDFVKQGNKAFISSKSISHDLMYYLYPLACNDAYWQDYYAVEDTLVKLNFKHPSLKQEQAYPFEYIYDHDPELYLWTFMDSLFFCNEVYSPVALGSINDTLVNFAQFQFGEGFVYLHTNPIAFANIQLLDKPGLEYAGNVFSHLDEGAIYWDGFSRVDEEVSRRMNNSNAGGGNRLNSDGPLKYILNQPALAWAWYLLLALAFLYLIFRAKRKQRIIPVLEQNENTSMEFMSTIGSLYFLRNDHKKLALQKMKLFLAYIRQRYSIATNQLDEEFVKKLSNHSEIPTDVINQILLFYHNIKSSTFVSEQTLISFHLEMDKFYKNCK